MLNPTQFQAKEEKVKVVDASLNEPDPLSEMHLLSEASSSLSRWETLEEEVRDLHAQHAIGPLNEDIVSSRT